jgi:hypothetical protein
MAITHLICFYFKPAAIAGIPPGAAPCLRFAQFAMATAEVVM